MKFFYIIWHKGGGGLRNRTIPAVLYISLLQMSLGNFIKELSARYLSIFPRNSEWGKGGVPGELFLEKGLVEEDGIHE
ncbi:MAG: hypothetical protein K2O91_26890 [Lachnospiraceae bacterium]|nr:hypothetical protein [Lachnospiraceae bacterium]